MSSVFFKEIMVCFLVLDKEGNDEVLDWFEEDEDSLSIYRVRYIVF